MLRIDMQVQIIAWLCVLFNHIQYSASEKTGLGLNIQKTKIIASGPITSWQIDGETMETVTDFIFLGSKITADGDCSHEIKRHLLLGRKAMANLDSVLKSRDITNKGPSSQSYDFSSSHVWMWELDHKESWGPKNWCFWTVVLEKTLKSSLDSKEIKPVNCKGNQCWIFTEGVMPKLQYFSTWWEELTHWKRPSCWERLKAGGEGDDRGWDGRMASTTHWTWVWTSSRNWWWTEKPSVMPSMGPQRVGHGWATDLNWLNTQQMHQPCMDSIWIQAQFFSSSQ